MEQTILYHHLKTYIIPLSIEYDTLIAFKLDEENIIIWFDGEISNGYSDHKTWINI
jgi:hypothetical protein